MTFVVIMLLFIWGNSLLPGSISGQESGWVMGLLEPALRWLRELIARSGWEISMEILVRKLAHFCEFALLGALMAALLERSERGKTRFLLAELFCLGAAAVDELIQRLVPDRGPSIKDVLLDFSGATVGVICGAALLWLMAQYKKNE